MAQEQQMQNSINVDVGAAIRQADAEVQRFKDQGDEVLIRSVAEKREMTADETAKLTEIQEKWAAADKRAKELRNWVEKTAATVKPDAAPTGDGTARAATRSYETFVRRAGQVVAEKAVESAEQAQQREAFEQWFRTGKTANEVALRALSTNIGNQGSFAIPVSFSNQIERRLLDFSGIMQSPVDVITTTSGEDILWPSVDDTANSGANIEEGTSAAELPDPTFGNNTLRAYNLTTNAIRVPNQLLQDSGIPMETLLVDLLAERAGRRMNIGLTNGTGANQPHGLVTATSSSTVASASSTTISYANLLNLQHAIDPAYRNSPSVAWQFSDQTLRAIRGIVDADGRPAWMPALSASLTEGAPGLLLGFRYFINQNMANIGSATGTKIVLFGDHSKYKVRRVGGLAIGRSNDLGLLTNTTIFVGFARYDGRLVQNAAMTAMTNA